jgi:hypothetical protein
MISVDVLLRDIRGDVKRPVVVWSNTVNDWLIVTKVVSDAQWEYAPMSAVRRGVTYGATTPLSQMPLVRP